MLDRAQARGRVRHGVAEQQRRRAGGPVRGQPLQILDGAVHAGRQRPERHADLVAAASAERQAPNRRGEGARTTSASRPTAVHPAKLQRRDERGRIETVERRGRVRAARGRIERGDRTDAGATGRRARRPGRAGPMPKLEMQPIPVTTTRWRIRRVRYHGESIAIWSLSGHHQPSA